MSFCEMAFFSSFSQHINLIRLSHPAYFFLSHPEASLPPQKPLPTGFWSAAMNYNKSGLACWPVWEDQGCILPAFPIALIPSPQLQVLVSPPISKTSLCGWIHLYKKAGRRLGRLDSDPICLCSLWNQAKNEVFFFSSVQASSHSF